MKLTAEQIYNKLVNEERILKLQGQIRFNLGSVGVIVNQKDAVGSVIQSWLQGWMDKEGIEYALNDNLEMPPDFYLNPEDKTTGLLEVKAFNMKASPGFDIADFSMYEEEVIEKPYMLNMDYLIFGYAMDNKGIVTIERLWLKKVWEITRAMQNWPINLQIKRGVVHKIRPGKWYATSRSFPPFDSREDFVAAIDETVHQNSNTCKDAAQWRTRFLKSYEKFYGIRLNIPRWEDIQNKYQ